MPLIVRISEERMLNEACRVALVINGCREPQEISFRFAKCLFLVGGLIGVPSCQILQNALDEASQMLCFANRAREYHCSESVGVEESLVEGAQLEVRRLILV